MAITPYFKEFCFPNTGGRLPLIYVDDKSSSCTYKICPKVKTNLLVFVGVYQDGNSVRYYWPVIATDISDANTQLEAKNENLGYTHVETIRGAYSIYDSVSYSCKYDSYEVPWSSDAHDYWVVRNSSLRENEIYDGEYEYVGFHKNQVHPFGLMLFNTDVSWHYCCGEWPDNYLDDDNGVYVYSAPNVNPLNVSGYVYNPTLESYLYFTDGTCSASGPVVLKEDNGYYCNIDDSFFTDLGIKVVSCLNEVKITTEPSDNTKRLIITGSGFESGYKGSIYYTQSPLTSSYKNASHFCVPEGDLCVDYMVFSENTSTYGLVVDPDYKYSVSLSSKIAYNEITYCEDTGAKFFKHFPISLDSILYCNLIVCLSNCNLCGDFWGGLGTDFGSFGSDYTATSCFGRILLLNNSGSCVDVYHTSWVKPEGEDQYYACSAYVKTTIGDGGYKFFDSFIRTIVPEGTISSTSDLINYSGCIALPTTKSEYTGAPMTFFGVISSCFCLQSLCVYNCTYIDPTFFMQSTETDISECYCLTYSCKHNDYYYYFPTCKYSFFSGVNGLWFDASICIRSKGGHFYVYRHETQNDENNYKLEIDFLSSSFDGISISGFDEENNNEICFVSNLYCYPEITITSKEPTEFTKNTGIAETFTPQLIYTFCLNDMNEDFDNLVRYYAANHPLVDTGYVPFIWRDDPYTTKIKTYAGIRYCFCLPDSLINGDNDATHIGCMYYGRTPINGSIIFGGRNTSPVSCIYFGENKIYPSRIPAGTEDNST